MIKSLLLLADVMATVMTVQGNYNYEQSLSEAATKPSPQYVKFSNSSGLQLKLTLPKQTNFSYTVVLQFRINSTLETLKNLKQPMHLIELYQGPYCYINSQNIVCSPMTSIPYNSLTDLNAWTQLTLIGDSQSKVTTLRLDQVSQSLSDKKNKFIPITTDTGFLGIDSLLRYGFLGDVREVFISYGAIPEISIRNLMNSVKVFNVATLCLYEFNPFVKENVLTDGMRYQTSTIVYKNQSTQAPILVIQRDASNHRCDSLDLQPLEALPFFGNKGEYNKGFVDYFNQKYNASQFINGRYSDGNVTLATFNKKSERLNYTISMWIKNEGKHNSTRNISDWKAHDFFTFDQIFSLYFDSQTTFKVHVFQQKSFQQRQSPSVFLPLHQWTNIQIQILEKGGIVVKTLNSNFVTQQTITESSFQHKPNPQPKLRIFNNFQGYAKSIKIWKKYYEIPINGAQKLGLIFNIDFQFANFKNGTGWTSQRLPALPGTIGQGFLFNQIQAPLLTKTSYGQLNSYDTLFDGIQCKTRQNQNIKLNGATIQQELLVDRSNEFTVEFWVLIEKTTSDVELFSVRDGSNQSLTIYLASQQLKCAPFGIDDTELVYGQINPVQEPQWQHITCGFKVGFAMWGQYLVYNRTDKLQTSEQQLFSESLGQSKTSTPNMYRKKLLNITIGHQNLTAIFKDIKLWTKSLDPAQVYLNRFKQTLPTESNLILNYKLMDGRMQPMNEIDGTFGRIRGDAVAQNWDSSILICPVDNYYNASSGMCVALPFNILPITYLSDTHVVNQILNTVEQNSVITSKYSQSNSLIYQDDIMTKTYFSSPNRFVQNTIIEPSTQKNEIRANWTQLGQEYENQFAYTVVDEKHHNFQLMVHQSLYADKCFVLVDSTSGKSYTEQILSTDDLTDLCFSIRQNIQSGCRIVDLYESEVEAYFSPWFSDLTSIPFKQRIGNNLKLCYSAETVRQFQANRPIHIIMSIKHGRSQQDVVYKITLIDQLNPKLEANAESIEPGQTLKLLANKSKNIQLNSEGGLVYQWICPESFANYCQNYNYLPILEISPEAFKQFSNTPFERHEFKLSIWSLDAGMKPYTTRLIFNNSLSVQWLQQPTPEFTILPPICTVSQDCHVEFFLYNYRLTDVNLIFQWEFQPTIDLTRTYMSLSNSVLIIKAGTLKENQIYALRVNILNSMSGQTGSNTASFQTQQPPVVEVQVQPTEGTMLQTKFKITLSGLNSQHSVVVYGVAPSGKSMQILNSQKIKFPYTISTTLPWITNLKFEVTNESGDTTTKTVIVDVVKQQKQWSELKSNYKKDDVAQRFKDYSFVVFGINQEVLLNKLDVASAVKIIESMLLESQQINNNTSVQGLIQVTALLAQVTNSKLSSKIYADAQNSLQLLTNMQNYKACLNQTDFQTNFVSVLSNLLTYSSTYKSDEQHFELQKISDSVISLKNLLLNDLCKLKLNKDIKLSTDSMQLHVMTIGTDSETKELSFVIDDDKISSVLVPLDQIILQTLGKNPKIKRTCLQVSFWKQNNVAGMFFENQNVVQDQMFYQISTQDSIDQQSYRYLDLTPQKIFLKHNYSDQYDKSELKCMNYDGISSWNAEQCFTQYHSFYIVCRCNVISNQQVGIIRQIRPQKELSGLKFQWPVLIVLVPLLIVGIAGPIIAFKLDQQGKDFIISFQEKPGIKNLFYNMKNVKSQQNKDQHAQVEYRMEEYYRLYILANSRNSSGQPTWQERYWILRRNYHPIVNVLQMYDWFYRRYVRMTVIILQLSLIALITNGLLSDQVSNVVPIFKNLWLWLFLALILATLTLPYNDNVTQLCKFKVPKNQAEENQDSPRPTYKYFNEIFVGLTYLIFTGTCFQLTCLLFTVEELTVVTQKQDMYTPAFCWVLTLFIGYFIYAEITILIYVGATGQQEKICCKNWIPQRVIDTIQNCRDVFQFYESLTRDAQGPNEQVFSNESKLGQDDQLNSAARLTYPAKIDFHHTRQKDPKAQQDTLGQK